MGLKVNFDKCINCGLCDEVEDEKELIKYCPTRAVEEDNDDSTNETIDYEG